MSLSLSHEGIPSSSKHPSHHRPHITGSLLTPKLVQSVADRYESGEASELHDKDGLQRWIADLFHRLPYRIEWVEHDPYRSLETMRAEVNASKTLQITTRNNESVFDPAVNLMFRAVHDADHIAHTCDFDVGGELRAGRIMTARCGDPWGRALIFSEIIAQACVAVAFGNFSRQKFVRFPRRFRKEILRRG